MLILILLVNWVAGASHTTYPPSSEQSSFFPESIVEPEGHKVRIHCEANPECFLATRGNVTVLVLKNSLDPHQVMIINRDTLFETRSKTFVGLID